MADQLRDKRAHLCGNTAEISSKSQQVPKMLFTWLYHNSFQVTFFVQLISQLNCFCIIPLLTVLCFTCKVTMHLNKLMTQIRLRV